MALTLLPASGVYGVILKPLRGAVGNGPLAHRPGASVPRQTAGHVLSCLPGGATFLVNPGTDLVNPGTGLVNPGTDLVNPGTDLVKQRMGAAGLFFTKRAWGSD